MSTAGRHEDPPARQRCWTRRSPGAAVIWLANEELAMLTDAAKVPFWL
jgi:hypothetical protein